MTDEETFVCCEGHGFTPAGCWGETYGENGCEIAMDSCGFCDNTGETMECDGCGSGYSPVNHYAI